ncbi:hypothetical protein OUZ56_029670 [Daphnia magna]|uniref:Uncharacterized protein n=1 Tax=Daphnia magna TaxID=35525 RepID=A0ABR0B7I6_9CRUS|nr:hypothetical protein OUZ56_029670 [Daphnia magna]
MTINYVSWLSSQANFKPIKGANKSQIMHIEEAYKQVIGMGKVVLHSLTDHDAHPSNALEKDIEKITDVIRAEISGEAHLQYETEQSIEILSGSRNSSSTVRKSGDGTQNCYRHRTTQWMACCQLL